MSTKILIGVLIALLAAAGWVIYSNNQTHQDQPEDAALTSVSFICGDGSHFIAEFPDDMRTLSVVIDGVTVRTLSAVAGAGTRFANAEYTYVFAGEDVTVTAHNFSTVCSQPLDPNLAPYNFGDPGEGNGTNDMAGAVTANIVGTWQSTDDEKFVRKFNGDGTMADLYDGAITATGTWTAFTADDQMNLAFTVEPHSVYLALTMADMPDEPLHFKVLKLTPEEVSLMYMERGGTLSFTKVE